MHSKRKPSDLMAVATLFTVGALFAVKATPRSPQQPARAEAQQIVLTIDPARSSVRWTLRSTLHTVHGTFTLKRGTVRLDSTGKASGEVIADATSGSSGNESRDKKMHKEILESARYPEIVFRIERIEGKVQPGVFTAQVRGVFVLHGSEHEVSLPVQAELAGDHWMGTTQFSVPHVEWGLKNPSTFLLKVERTVNVTVELKGSVTSSKT
jgi:polyisoprenoid-binding protein YceI